MSENGVLDCWVVTDGRAGIENQALGLAERMANRAPLRVTSKRIVVAAPWRYLPGAVWGDPFGRLSKRGALLRPPFPHLWIGCGRVSIPLTRAIKKASPETFTIQLQAPGGDLRDFDLVAPPFHDRLNGDNVFSLIGSPNRIEPAALAEAARALAPSIERLGRPRVAVLIGGDSRTHKFNAGATRKIAEALQQLAATGAGLMVTTSRRTDPSVAEEIRTALSACGAFFWHGDGAAALSNAYVGMLGAADHIVVTEDSVNMAGEAASTGKPVHIFPLPKRLRAAGSRKFEHFHNSLVEYGAARPFQLPFETWTYKPLNETARAADEVLRRYAAARAERA